MKRLRWLFAAIFLLAIAAVGSLFLPFLAAPPGLLVNIDLGSSTRQISQQLARQGIVRYSWQLALARLLQPHRPLQAGEYEFNQPATPWQIFDRLARGDVHFYLLRIPEGYNMFDIAQTVGQHGLISENDFLDAARSDLSATIHVFTPAKDVVLLPEGSSALDFAYHVHSEVGNHASGVKVNGRLVPFRTLVKTGDNVEVLTREDAHPTRDWLEWAHSHRALEKIRKRLRESLSDKAVALGRDILDGALRKQGSSLKRVLSDRELAGRLKDAGYEDVDELAGKLLAGSVGPTEAGRILLPQPIEPPPAPSAFQSLLQRVRRPAENAILVSGQTDILVDYARCCRPMKGESIIGYITRGRGLSVHKEECTQLRGLDAERFISVTWDAQSRTLHQGLLHLVLEDRPGMLAAITGVCSTAKINLWRANVRQDEDDRAICDLGVSVYDIGELDGLVKKLKSVRGVVAVERAAAL